MRAAPRLRLPGWTRPAGGQAGGSGRHDGGRPAGRLAGAHSGRERRRRRRAASSRSRTPGWCTSCPSRFSRYPSRPAPSPRWPAMPAGATRPSGRAPRSVSTRAVVVAAGLGVAMALLAAAWPIARFFGISVTTARAGRGDGASVGGIRARAVRLLPRLSPQPGAARHRPGSPGGCRDDGRLGRGRAGGGGAGQVGGHRVGRRGGRDWRTRSAWWWLRGCCWRHCGRGRPGAGWRRLARAGLAAVLAVRPSAEQPAGAWLVPWTGGGVVAIVGTRGAGGSGGGVVFAGASRCRSRRPADGLAPVRAAIVLATSTGGVGTHVSVAGRSGYPLGVEVDGRSPTAETEERFGFRAARLGVRSGRDRDRAAPPSRTSRRCGRCGRLFTGVDVVHATACAPPR